MKQWRDDFLYFWKNKAYLLILSLTAVCGYGFLVTHFAVGIDDTPYAYYFEEGLAAIVGRWVLFLLNKVLPISEIAPFLTDFAGVLLLMAAVTVWCTLFRSVLKDSLPMAGYVFFACIFLSCPLIAEVYTYYLHNGIALGYLCCGISLLFFESGLEQSGTFGGRGRLFLGSTVFLWIALGCYESFMVVWLLGICLLLLTRRLADHRQGIFGALAAAAVTALLGMVLRSLMIGAVTGIFGLEYLKEEAVQRSVTEMAGWLFQPGAFSEFAMVVKRLFVMYGVFGFAYYPVKIFVLAACVMGACSLYYTFRKKDPWILLLCIGAFIASFLLAVIEGKATYYRSAQFLPVICGFGALLLVYACRGLWKRGKGRRMGKYVVTAALCVVLWNQCTDLNHWFYVDFMKYESAKEVAGRIAYDLESGFDTAKPLVFTGTYEVPQGIIKDAYVPYGSETFYRMKRITDRIDEHLLEKFYRTYGVWVAQTPALSVIDWGKAAFGTDEELIRFFAMQGHTFLFHPDPEVYAEAQQRALSMPAYPEQGYITDAGEYLIINL